MVYFGKRFVAIENKAFEFNRGRSRDKAVAISITERTRGKVFRATTSESGCHWMGKYLCESSVGINQQLRYCDDWVSIIGSPRHNVNGGFVEFVLFKKSDGRKKVICIPQGEENVGWMQAGIALLAVLGIINDEGELKPRTTNKFLGKPALKGEGRRPPLAAQRTNNVEKEKKSTSTAPMFTIESQSGIHNLSWWSTMVICRPQRRVTSWDTVKREITSKFGEISLAAVETGEAVLFMESVEKADSLAALGAISFDGIPMHLKKPEILRMIAKEWGSSIEVEESSMLIYSSFANFKLFNPLWNVIPRLITLVEKGSSYAVYLDVGFDKPVTALIPAWLPEFSNHSEEEEVDNTGRKGLQSGSGSKSPNGVNTKGSLGEGAPDKFPPLQTTFHVEEQVRPILNKVDHDNVVQQKSELFSWSDAKKQQAFLGEKRSYADIVKQTKGKEVVDSEGPGLGCNNRFSLLETGMEEGEAQCCKDFGPQPILPINNLHRDNRKWRKPKGTLGWVRGPNLALSNQFFSAQIQKRKEQTQRVVHRVLHNLEKEARCGSELSKSFAGKGFTRTSLEQVGSLSAVAGSARVSFFDAYRDPLPEQGSLQTPPLQILKTISA
ncbi:hypothetical protein FRX31_009539 [Thalictrum thalictroides]|uniref:Uncharacterized protein n=1 Tax=Thalictrum thalictroides TaxID=46969 RepID=A0A7J6WUZ8_THATH|nr:hypothetical protein FRX31_009539 [Thalictrum thalictroides]